MRDWRWRKASFDGLGFYVNTGELPGSRRIVKHEYPGSDKWDLEDLGRCAPSLEVTAYFLSETADSDSAALRARLELSGPGLLILPMFGARLCRAIKWAPRWEKEALNYVGFSISFLEEGKAGAPVALGLGAAQLALMGAGLAPIFGGAIGQALTGAQQTSFLRSDMAAQVASLGAQIEIVRQSVPLPDAVSSAAQLAIADAVASLSGGPAVNLGAIATGLFAQLDTIVAEQAGGAPASVLATAMTDSLAAYSASLSHWGTSPLVSIVPLASATVFAAEAARLLATAPYTNRQEAVAARTMIAALTGQILPLYQPLGPDATDAFDEMYGKAAEHISSAIINLAPVVLVETNVALPANILAWRLYADPNRSQELVDRNRVATPAFMPLQFEAASS